MNICNKRREECFNCYHSHFHDSNECCIFSICPDLKIYAKCISKLEYYMKEAEGKEKRNEQ
jgi:hypothetical protein